MITFRDATPADIPLLQELARTIWHEAFPTIITRDQIELMLAKMYDADTVKREMESGVVWKVLEDGDRPIGYVSCSMITPDVCKVHKVYVLPEYHGQGLGRHCLEEAARYARAHGASTMILMVNRANTKAQRAYRAFGFIVAESKDWEFAPGFILHDYVMSLQLTS